MKNQIAVNKSLNLLALEKTSEQISGTNNAQIQTIVAQSKQSIRSVIKTGDTGQINNMTVNLMQRVHALAILYSGANFAKMNDADIEILISECSNFIINNYPQLGIEEIREAFQLAASHRIDADIRAYYGQFNITMLGDVLSAYLEFRKNVLATYEAALPLPAKQIDKDMLNKIARYEVIKKYNQLLQTDDLNEIEEAVQAFWGRILVDAGIINFTPEEKLEIYQEARERVLKNLSSSIQKGYGNKPAHELRSLRAVLKGDRPDELKMKIDAEYSKLIVIKSIIQAP